MANAHHNPKGWFGKHAMDEKDMPMMPGKKTVKKKAHKKSKAAK